MQYAYRHILMLFLYQKPPEGNDSETPAESLAGPSQIKEGNVYMSLMQMMHNRFHVNNLTELYCYFDFHFTSVC